MRTQSCLLIVFIAVRTCLTQTDKYTDENRPYKFGFNIEGYQHRQEEKDEKGIIKGEYGFITADGYYRVTVYATDENGDFRIISMKNYYVGFPPEDPQITPIPPTQFGARRLPSDQPQVNPLSAARGNGERRGKDPVQLTGLTACSDCLIPTTKKPEAGTKFGGGRDGDGPVFSTRRGHGFGGGSGGDAPVFGARVRGGTSEFGEQGGRGGDVGGERGSGGASGGRGRDGPFGGTPQRPGGVGGFGNGPKATPAGGGGSARFPGSSRGQFQNDTPNRDTSRTPTGRPEVGTVRDGLPRGVSVDNIKALLYTFNYTVGFHGHHEDGYRNGDKEGDYFFDGRDGVERKVEYVANEFGYQPNITFIDLPENDVRRPKEETEKEYGLKGYEFKWFYRK